MRKKCSLVTQVSSQTHSGWMLCVKTLATNHLVSERQTDQLGCSNSYTKVGMSMYSMKLASDMFSGKRGFFGLVETSSESKSRNACAEEAMAGFG